MPCNRKDCPHPGPHVHLRLRDERAIADVLAARYWAKRQRAAITAVTDKTREAGHAPSRPAPGSG